MSGAEPPTREQLLLPDHHDEIARLLDALVLHAAADDRPALDQRFGLVEQAIRAHVRAEEEALLPRFAAHDPVEARAIADEHAAIRRDLDELGVSVELGFFSVDVARRLAERLKAHAAREDRSLYPWAEEALRGPGEELRTLVDGLRARLHLGRDAPPP